MHKSLNTAPISPWILLPQVQNDVSRRRAEQRNRTLSRDIGLRAVHSLYDELTLYPKPGLVSPVDNGSHTDMDASTFMRSLFSLRHYFIRITRAGMDGAPFSELKQFGISAEASMLKATGGINTHRGAIFCIGMLCASIGYCRANGIAATPEAIRATLLIQWGRALSMHCTPQGDTSHGLRVAAAYSASGAREEVALGLPSVFEVALPALRNTLAAGGSWEHARVNALFSLMAHISDTNVYHRAGAEGADIVKRASGEFLARGGTAACDWKERALQCHRTFVDKKISPGGAADLLAASCLVHKMTTWMRPV
ncbi:triphosphoribosyl-dephospho-CoA synthase MdcB [Noviherbaspirillum sp. ST9]|uniref:triphosphoribosyl-dephospho-CoA synthase MdcB n=1 Tax=Noviherbaspirillum sp. ST9 TaxID=3401606 RepID=UPI003B58718F